MPRLYALRLRPVRTPRTRPAPLAVRAPDPIPDPVPEPVPDERPEAPPNLFTLKKADLVAMAEALGLPADGSRAEVLGRIAKAQHDG